MSPRSDESCFGRVLWERPLSGHFRPALHGDMVFTAERRGTFEHHLSALDLEGQTRWSIRDRIPFAGVPWAAHGLAVVTTYDAQVLGVDLRDATVRWTRKLGRVAANQFANVPTVLEELGPAIQYVSTTGREAGALDPSTGRTLWKRAVHGVARGIWPAMRLVGDQAPMRFTVVDGAARWGVAGELACTTPNAAVLWEEPDQLVLRAADDGTVRWRLTAAPRGPSRVVGETLLILAGEQDDAWVLAAHDVETGERKWRRELGARHETYRLLTGHHANVCFIDQPLEAFRVDTGETVGTLAELDPVVAPHPPPRVGGGHVLVEGFRSGADSAVVQLREWTPPR